MTRAWCDWRQKNSAIEEEKMVRQRRREWCDQERENGATGEEEMI